MSSPAIKLLLPRWTKRVVTDMGGRDPLGLSRVAFIITDYLLMGITSQTDRARYYSFYTWALWHIEREEHPTSYEDFRNAFRRREAAMALATLAANPDASLVGVDATRVYWNRGKESGLFDCDFKVLSNSMGGYGQYYGGSIYNLKLSKRTEDGIDHVTKGTAEALAQSFQSGIRNTPYIKKRLFGERQISIRDLVKTKDTLTLDALNGSFAAQEKKKLIEIFFGLDERKLDERTLLRRQTLTQLIHLIAEYENRGYRVGAKNNFEVDEYLLYPMYYGCLWPEEERTFSYKGPEKLTICRSLWSQFCLHQFVATALEDALCAVLEATGAEYLGLTVGGISAALGQEDFRSFLSDATGKPCKSPRALFSAIGIASVPDEKLSNNLKRVLLPKHELSEARILHLEIKGPEGKLARTALLLAVIYGKWRGSMRSDNALTYVGKKAGTQLWAGNLLNALDGWLSTEIEWEHALCQLIEQFIVNQHDRIFYEKGKLDSRWLTRTDGRVFKEQDYEPVWRASRLRNAARIMADLELLQIDVDRVLTTTPSGRKLLRQMLDDS